MAESKSFSRSELLTMATAYHGKVFSPKQFDEMSDEKLTSLCHPLDVGRVGKGW